MNEKLYYRPSHEHRAPASKKFYIDAWVEVCDIPQHQAEEQFAEAVAYGDIREYIVKTDETVTPQSGAPAGTDYSHDCRCDNQQWAEGCGFNSCPRRKTGKGEYPPTPMQALMDADTQWSGLNLKHGFRLADIYQNGTRH